MSVQLLGPLDTYLAPYVELVLLVLAVANLGTRMAAHRRHVRQAAEGGAENISRHLGHEAVNVALVLVAFYYMTVEVHSGMVFSTLVVGMVAADVFEFEARKVEARREIAIERPTAAIGASMLVFLYAAFLSLFFIVEPLWNAIV